MKSSKPLMMAAAAATATALLMTACGGGGGGGGAGGGAAWGEPVTVSTITGSADAPSLAVDGSGNAGLIWTQYNSTLATPHYSLWSSYWKAGAGWQEADERWSHDGTRNLRLDMNKDGASLVAWPNPSAANEIIHTRFDTTSTPPMLYGAGRLVAMPAGTEIAEMRAVPYGADKQVVAYFDDGTSPGKLRAFVGEAPGTGAFTDLATLGSVTQLELLPLADNKVLLVWCGTGSYYSSVYDGAGVGSWSATQIAGSCGDARRLILKASPDGRQAVVVSKNNYKGEWEYARYDVAGDSWGAMTSGYNTPHEDVLPGVALDNKGRLLVVSTDYDSGTDTSSLLAAVAITTTVGGSSTETWSTAISIGDETRNGDYGDPRAAVDKNGNAYVVWSQYGSTGWDVLVRRFNVATERLEDIVELDPGPDDAVYPQIAVDSNNKAIAAWVSIGGISGNMHAGVRAAHQR